MVYQTRNAQKKFCLENIFALVNLSKLIFERKKKFLLNNHFVKI